MSNYLFLVTEYNSANGICCRAVMKALIARGDRVFCVTNREHGDLPEQVLDGVKVYRVRPRLVYRIESYLSRKKKKGMTDRLLSLAHKVLNKSKLLLRVFSWPWISPAFTRRIYRKAKAICHENTVDYIIPVYSQIDTLVAAKRIKADFPKIKFVPYFLDSLSGGYGPKMFSQEWVIKRGKKWERRLLPTADKIILMKSSEAHHREYSKDEVYYKNMVFLDLPLLQHFDPATEFSPHLVQGKRNLLYIGTIAPHIRNPKYFLELFHLIEDETLRFTIIGTSTCEEYLQGEAKKDPRIRLLPFVSHEEAVQAMLSADVLVNLGNSNSKMTPSKIFEYMSTCKPIISTAPIEDEPSAKYLQQYPAALIVRESLPIEENKQLMECFLQTEQRVERPLFELFYMNTPQAFLDALSE